MILKCCYFKLSGNNSKLATNTCWCTQTASSLTNLRCLEGEVLFLLVAENGPIDCGTVAGNIRRDFEKTLGKNVVSKDNYWILRRRNLLKSSLR